MRVPVSVSLGLNRGPVKVGEEGFPYSVALHSPLHDVFSTPSVIQPGTATPTLSVPDVVRSGKGTGVPKGL